MHAVQIFLNFKLDCVSKFKMCVELKLHYRSSNKSNSMFFISIQAMFKRILENFTSGAKFPLFFCEEKDKNA